MYPYGMGGLGGEVSIGQLHPQGGVHTAVIEREELLDSLAHMRHRRAREGCGAVA